MRTVPQACVKVQPGLALAPPTTHTWCILYTKHLKKRPTSLLNLRQRLTPSIVASTAVLQAVGLATATLIVISWLYMAKKKNKAAAAQAAAQHADEDSPVDYEAEEQEQEVAVDSGRDSGRDSNRDSSRNSGDSEEDSEDKDSGDARESAEGARSYGTDATVPPT